MDGSAAASDTSTNFNPIESIFRNKNTCPDRNTVRGEDISRLACFVGRAEQNTRILSIDRQVRGCVVSSFPFLRLPSTVPNIWSHHLILPLSFRFLSLTFHSWHLNVVQREGTPLLPIVLRPAGLLSTFSATTLRRCVCVPLLKQVLEIRGGWGTIATAVCH